MEGDERKRPTRRPRSREALLALMTAVESALKVYERDGRIDFTAEQELEVAMRAAKGMRKRAKGSKGR